MIVSKKLPFLLLLCLTTIGILNAQTLIIPYDASAATIDGVMQPAEWATAQKRYISVSATDSVQVCMKQDGSAFYFAFTGKLESANILFPEVLFDPQLLRTNSWVNSQWWFHVSATDCEHNGDYGIYNNCQGVQPDWVGVPNFIFGAPMTDTVEIKIPFSKIGFDPALRDTLGMALLVTNTATIYKLWPGTADRNIPLTWSKIAIARPTAVPAVTPQYKITAAPNPANNALNIVCEGNIVNKKITAELLDIRGNSVVKGNAENGTIRLATHQLPPANYTLRIYDDKGGKYTEQILIAH